MGKTLESARIVVIGAGPAGIAAATKLLEAGCGNVLILEAESRYGGRIRTVPFADNVIDLGAQWCHGEKNNVIYETLQEHNKLNLLESSGETFSDSVFIRSNKQILDKKVVEPLQSIALNVVSEEDLVNYEGSLGSYIIDKYWSEVGKLDEKVNGLVAKEFLENFNKGQCSVEGSDHLFEVSAKGLLEYSTCDGDNLLTWKDKGFKTILEILMKATPDNPLGVLSECVLFNHRVQHINWLGKSQGVKIKCFNGQVIMADHVVYTCSVGVLKEFHASTFQPSLPASKIRAIEGINFGTVDKFFMEFEVPFGPADWSGMCFLWLEEDLKDLRNSNHFWLESVFSFHRVWKQPRILEGWIIGPHARYMETLAEEEVLEGILWLFQKFLSFDIPKPMKFQRTQWHSNVHFRGSYSCRSMLTEELRTGARDLEEPLKNANGAPMVLFAGEATNSHHYSTVHGAVESGWREVQRLVDFYKKLPSQL